MTIAERRSNALWIGSAFWLAGIGCIFGGIPQHAWLPICWGGFALGYRYALLPFAE